MTLTTDKLLSVSKNLQLCKDEYERECKRIRNLSLLYAYVNELAAKLDFAGLPVASIYAADIYCSFKSVDQVLRTVALLESQGYEFDYDGLEISKDDGRISLRIINCPLSSIIDIRFVLADDATCKLIEHKRVVTREIEVIERVIIC